MPFGIEQYELAVDHAVGQLLKGLGYLREPANQVVSPPRQQPLRFPFLDRQDPVAVVLELDRVLRSLKARGAVAT